MCKLFIQANSELWERTQRSLRINGMVTSIRMENTYWQTLDEIAKRDGLSVPSLINRLFYESVDAGHDMGNFTSFLRVCCSRYFKLQLDGHIPKDQSVPISSLDADKILYEENTVA